MTPTGHNTSASGTTRMRRGSKGSALSSMVTTTAMPGDAPADRRGTGGVRGGLRADHDRDHTAARSVRTGHHRAGSDLDAGSGAGPHHRGRSVRAGGQVEQLWSDNGDRF